MALAPPHRLLSVLQALRARARLSSFVRLCSFENRAPQGADQAGAPSATKGTPRSQNTKVGKERDVVSKEIMMGREATQTGRFYFRLPRRVHSTVCRNHIIRNVKLKINQNYSCSSSSANLITSTAAATSRPPAVRQTGEQRLCSPHPSGQHSRRPFTRVSCT